MSIITDGLIDIARKFGSENMNEDKLRVIAEGLEQNYMDTLLNVLDDLGVPSKLNILGYDEKVYEVNRTMTLIVKLLQMRNQGYTEDYKDILLKNNCRFLICPSTNEQYGMLCSIPHIEVIGKKLMENDNGPYLFNLLTNTYEHRKFINFFRDYYNKVDILKEYLDKEPSLRQKKKILLFTEDEQVNYQDWEFKYLTEKITGITIKEFNKEYVKIIGKSSNKYFEKANFEGLDMCEYAYKIIIGCSPAEAYDYCKEIHIKYKKSSTNLFIAGILYEKICEDCQK